MTRRLRSQDWFDNPDHLDLTALYLERFMNYGLTPEELRTGRPIIGIAQSGSDLAPCNRVHLDLAKRAADGIRDAGGIPMEFPIHPIFENCRRPTAALDRNLAFMGLVEILDGYPLDGVVLTTGCDKTTPAGIMAACTMDLPAIVLSGGPMLDGHFEGQLAGSGSVIWQSRKRLAAGEIDAAGFMEAALSSAPSVGHCNTMGTASTMNAVAETLGLSLTGCAAIPAAYRERSQMAYQTGKRAVELVHDDIRPSHILSLDSFINAMRAVSALGGSTNAQPHINAMALHAGFELPAELWQAEAYDIPLIVNMQPTGDYLGERFHRAGGVPAVLVELEKAGLLNADAMTVNGATIGQAIKGCQTTDREMIRTCAEPLKSRAGFLVLKGNFFDFAIMKTSAIDDAFRARYLEKPHNPGVFECRAVVFEGAEDYHARINDPELAINANSILVMRGAGPVGWPGSAEVVNMQPPDRLIAEGILSLPTLGDGRQSGTSGSPSILHVTPESALGGGLALLEDGDLIRIDLNEGRCDVWLPEGEYERRVSALNRAPLRQARTPWQHLYQTYVQSLQDGASFDFVSQFRQISRTLPRHNH